jgi:hypothetical protein
MCSAVAEIIAHLDAVDHERRQRLDVNGLSEKVVALKAFQQRRFAHTYADLLISARYAAASRFFLEELYGPADFSQRDAQFARVVPSLVRLFPREIVETVLALGALHALSEHLDTALAKELSAPSLDARTYVRAWQAAGRSAERDRQISLTLEVASRLDRLTRRPLLRNTLRLMRSPARAAGLSELQHFLESGFDAFAAMRGTQEFSSIVECRERSLATWLFEVNLARVGDPAPQDSRQRLP